MFDTGSVADRLTQAHALIAGCAADITADITGPAAAEGLREAIAADNQLTLTLVLLTGRLDTSNEYTVDGSRSAAGWLRQHARFSPVWGSQRVTVARQLDRIPATRAAWAAGDVNFEHVRIIAGLLEGLDDAQTADLDRALAHAAADPNCSPARLKDIAAAVLEHIAPDAQEKARDDKTGRQSLHLSDVPDGGYLTGHFDAETTAILRAALTKFTPDPTKTTLADGTVIPALPLSHRQALGLAEMARQALDFGTGHPAAANRPHLVATMTFDDLASRIGVGYLPNGGTLPIADLRRIACDSKIIPLLLGSKGQPLDIGRATRTVPIHMRHALNERDKGCRTPGCDRPPSACEAHHVVHWIDFGPTCLDNLVLLCRGHHQDHHKGRLKIKAHGNQHFTFTQNPSPLRT